MPKAKAALGVIVGVVVGACSVQDGTGSRPAEDEPSKRDATPDASAAPASRAAFDLVGSAYRPRFSAEVRGAVPHAAEVLLPTSARDSFEVTDVDSRVSVRARWTHAPEATGVPDGEKLVYLRDDESEPVFEQRPSPEGTEDFVHLPRPIAGDELRYEVTLGDAVSGLRLVARTLEFVDRDGVPRLRVAPPYLVDANGKRHEASLDVEGCAFDASDAVPWGRPIVPPGARVCGVRVSWRGTEIAYPAVLDPSWTATGSLAVARNSHGQATLANGNVLVLGGCTYVSCGGTCWTSAEVWNAGTGTWASAGVMSATRTTPGMRVTLLANGKALVMGGDGWTFSKKGELYDPASGWSTTIAAAADRFEAQLVALTNGKAIYVGGQVGASVSTSSEIYDPATNAWTAGPSLNVARINYSAALVQDGTSRVVVTGGAGFGNLTSEVYTPGGAFVLKANTNNVFMNGQAAVGLLNGKVLVSQRNISEVYDPALDKWTNTGNPGMSGAATNYTPLTLFGTTTALLVGPTSAFAFDTNAMTWSPTASPIVARSDTAMYNVSTLADGRVMITGGVNPSCTAVKNAEIYGASALGTSCSTGSDCASGFCADGVCCNAACTGQCEACSAGGTCNAVIGAPVGTRAACSGSGVCAGSCNGTNRSACTYPNGTTTCAASTCTAATYSAPSTCSAGSCVAPAPTACAGNLQCADAATCKGSCLADGDCVSGYYCAGGACLAKKDLGASCGGDHECKLGHCADGVCCDAACAGQCEACSAGGQCAAVVGAPVGARSACAGIGVCASVCDGINTAACTYPSGTVCAASSCSGATYTGVSTCAAGSCVAPASSACAGELQCADATSCKASCAGDGDCVAGFYCTSGNTCAAKKDLGTSCGGDHECTLGHCADGVCCNAACTGQCEACSAAGQCTAVVGAPVGGRNACAGSGACGSVCDGTNTAACTYPSGTTCAAATCTGSTYTGPSTCATGACAGPSPSACAGHLVCADATSCRTDCQSDAHCVTGYHCNAAHACEQNAGLGGTCSGDAQCGSGHCVDGVCCDAACTGQCEACDATGACKAVTGAPRGGRAACGGTGACAAQCDGANRTACAFPGTATQCASASCVNGRATSASFCDGQGTCPAGQVTSCANGCAGAGCAGASPPPPPPPPAVEDAAPPPPPSEPVDAASPPSERDAGIAAAPQQEAGCGCKVVGPRTTTERPAFAAVAGVVLVLSWRRRRRSANR